MSNIREERKMNCKAATLQSKMERYQRIAVRIEVLNEYIAEYFRFLSINPEQFLEREARQPFDAIPLTTPGWPIYTSTSSRPSLRRWLGLGATKRDSSRHEVVFSFFGFSLFLHVLEWMMVWKLLKELRDIKQSTIMQFVWFSRFSIFPGPSYSMVDFLADVFKS